MRAVLLLAMGLATSLTLGTPARAEEGPWYFSTSAGAFFREDVSGPARFFRFSNPGVVVPGTQHASFDPGYLANLAVGYKFPLQFRVEAEVGFGQDHTAKLNPQANAFPELNGSDFNNQSGGDTKRYMGTINAFYDLPSISLLTPYLGAGMGAEHASVLGGTFVDAAGTRFTQPSGSANRGIAIIEGGVTFSVSNGLSVVPAYRYIRFFGGGADGAAHIAKLGLRYSF